MRSTAAAFIVVALCGTGLAHAEVPLPFASHRAAYELTLLPERESAPANSQKPVSAGGLIAYEFRGSSCEGYASNFRQVTEIQRNEGDPVTGDTSAALFEDGEGKLLRFQVDTKSGDKEEPTVVGSAAHKDADATLVEITKPKREKVDLGKDVLFPTQHIARIIEAAKRGDISYEARVFDGTDGGKKLFQTLSVIGKPASKPSDDFAVADSLKSVRRWPLVISYFDEKGKDSAPEYVESFDLYENGVSGTLRIDYNTFSLLAQMKKFESLPTAHCAK